MNWQMILIETIIVALLFNGIVFSSLYKNPIWWIHDYPKDIQDVYFETHEQIPAHPLSKTALIKKGIALLAALLLLIGIVSLAHPQSFSEGFWGSFAIWTGINIWDCFFMDWVLFANLKGIRLPGTEHMDKAYHQKKYHFVHGLIGTAIGIVPCLIVGAVIALML